MILCSFRMATPSMVELVEAYNQGNWFSPNYINMVGIVSLAIVIVFQVVIMGRQPKKTRVINIKTIALDDATRAIINSVDS